VSIKCESFTKKKTFSFQIFVLPSEQQKMCRVFTFGVVNSVSINDQTHLCDLNIDLFLIYFTK